MDPATRPVEAGARWDDAVRLGAGALVVIANVDTSYPILERLGFRAVGRVRLLADRSATRGSAPSAAVMC